MLCCRQHRQSAVYSTCLFCNGSLGSNDSIGSFPVGRRLAFDSGRGRLWVVCTHCARWNLSPLEERWEAIEDCERRFRATHMRVSTGNIGLAPLDSGLELVRIGRPLRPEFAAWRYGRQLQRRRRRTWIAAGTGAAGAVATGAALFPAAASMVTMSAGLAVLLMPGLTMAMATVPALVALATRDYLRDERVVARFAHGRRVLLVRAKHLCGMELRVPHNSADAAVEVRHDRGTRTFVGAEALHATSVILAGANRFGADGAYVDAAVQHIEDAGDADRFLSAAAARGSWRGGRTFSMLNEYRGIGAMKLTPTERLALEMAVHEEAERRAMDGELATLEAAWRDADVIARIVDEELTPWPLVPAVQSPSP